MARIQDLPAASEILDTDLFVLQQGSEAKKLTGEQLKAYIEGHGGVANIVLNADYTLTFEMTDGESITLGSIRGQQGQRGDAGVSPIITLTPTAGGTNLTITDAEGEKTTFIANGEGAGDMMSSVYDPNGDVAAEGGIPQYVENHGSGVFVVDISSHIITTTIAQMNEAYQNGYTLIAKSNSDIYQLSSISSTNVTFSKMGATWRAGTSVVNEVHLDIANFRRQIEAGQMRENLYRFTVQLALDN